LCLFRGSLLLAAQYFHHKGMARTVTRSGALACFAVLTDNMLRRIEGQEETIFLWVRSGGWDVIFVFGIVSVVLQLLFWPGTVDLGDRRTHRR
jgi:hypothetical protein